MCLINSESLTNTGQNLSRYVPKDALPIEEGEAAKKSILDATLIYVTLIIETEQVNLNILNKV